jgi:hypothetical protein
MARREAPRVLAGHVPLGFAPFGAPSPQLRGQISKLRTLKRVAARSPHVCFLVMPAKAGIQ